MNTSVHFSSATDLWSTPDDFFAKLNQEFSFGLDVCATPENAKCAKFYTREDDGLKQDWYVPGLPAVWMNSPYGNPERPCKKVCVKKKCAKRGFHCTAYVPGIIDWVKKAVEEFRKGATVVALVPARTDSQWFQKYVLPYAELRFVKGRLKFGGHKNAAPFPSVVAIYRGVK